MNPEIEHRLAEFERRHKPDSKTYLVTFREEVVYLHFKGYSLRATFEYLKEQGVGCSQRTFERWVKESIDFAKEEVPEAAKRVRPWAAESLAGGEGGRRRARVGPVAQKALVSEEGANFSLAGAAADSPILTGGEGSILSGGVVPESPGLPKLPVLVDKKGGGDLHSKTATTEVASRAEALAQARELREKNFRTPVDRALGDPERRK